MSKQAQYQGLATGLMAFGQNLGYQMEESARQRRENSLINLRRQWQIEDAEAAQAARTQAVESERDWQVDLLGIRNEFDRDQQAWESENRTPLMQAQIESQQALTRQRNAQAQAALARGQGAGGAASFFNNLDPEDFTHESMVAAERIIAEGGSRADALAALTPKAQRATPLFDQGRVTRNALDAAESAFPDEDAFGNSLSDSERVSEFVERDPMTAQQAGIKETDSLGAAIRKYAEFYTNSFMQNPAGLMQSAPSGDRTELDMADEAVAAGRPVQEVAQMMLRRGVPAHEVSAWVQRQAGGG